jgi:hypothetical protein
LRGGPGRRRGPSGPAVCRGRDREPCYCRAGDLDRAEALARAVTDPDSQQQALAALASAIAQAGDLDRARGLFALALSADSPEIIWWIEELSQSFPDVIAGARTMFFGAYTSEP